ncbi:MAG: hypothetical protein ACW97Z_08080 [Candidatus Hodarchaeales archaeon]
MIISSQPSLVSPRPNVLIGDYDSCLHFIIENKYDEWVVPNLLWIEYRVIPLSFFYQISHQHPNLNSSLYFLEMLSFEDYNKILGSNMLSTLHKDGFGSLIVNYPHFFTNNHENWAFLKKLASSLVVTVIVPKDLFPLEECTQIVVNSP